MGGAENNLGHFAPGAAYELELSAAAGAPTLSFRRTMSWCLPPPARRATPSTTMGRASSARMGPRATRAALPIRPTASRPAPEDEQPCFTSPPPRVHPHDKQDWWGAERMRLHTVR